MATQQDLQDLLRLLTVGRKLPMMQAMTQIKALQAANLRSIKDIAEASLADVESAVKDQKGAKALQGACKSALKKGESGKRPAPDGTDAGSPAKRRKASGLDGYTDGPVEMTPQELESSLELPLSTDEEVMAETVIQTNRAPLVLAFAVELLRYTMPEQPLSSRLSLAQAVVSANSRSKAVSLGLEKGQSADDEGWGEGQPRVFVMGREIAVLKRGGYEWRGEETVETEETEGGQEQAKEAETQTQESATQESKTASQASAWSAIFQPTSAASWSASRPISLKKSTFIARATHIADPAQRQVLIRTLIEANPALKTATHNAWAYRVKPPATGASSVREDSFDDGETGCGNLMLRIMREADAVDTLVVLTRWFGGVLLGPDRWRLMRNCVQSALAERLRKTGAEVTLGGEAVWGLDLEGMRSKSNVGGRYDGSGSRPGQTGVVGMHIHRPEAARAYILKSFATAEAPDNEGPEGAKKAQKKTQKALDAEKAENLGILLGALRIVLDSWADHLTATELDRRAWSWYVAVRPEVAGGPGGWGAKGQLKIADILNLRRKDTT